MFAFDLSQAKSMFFDRTAVTSRLSKAKRKAFSQAGGLTRKVARRSMKPASKRILKQIKEKYKQVRRLDRRTQTPSVVMMRSRLYSEINALQKRAASKPGEPPKTKVGTIKKQLLYAFDPRSESVVVGPILFKPKSGAPETLEFSGGVQIGPARINVAARPFMGPALTKVQPQVAGFFRDSL